MNLREFMSREKGFLTKTSKYIMNEASFGAADLTRVVLLVKNLVEKKLGMKLYPFGGERNNFDEFSNAEGKGVGLLYVLDNGNLVRFNWEKSKKSSTLTSIDVFNEIKDLSPSRRLDVPQDYNIVQSIDVVVNFLKGHNITESLDEGGYSKVKKDAAKKYNIDVTLPAKDFWKRVEELGGADTRKMKSKKGKKETSKRAKEVKAASKTMDKKAYADPDVVFQDLDDLLNMVISGLQKSLIITGMAGIGKTFGVMKEIESKLGPRGTTWEMRSGNTAPYGFYEFIYANRNKIVVLDDMDSVLKDKEIGGMLKSLLDTTQNELSWISNKTQSMDFMTPDQREQYEKDLEVYLSKVDPDMKPMKLPNRFEFTGSIIFISNLYKDKFDSALLSRSMYIDITLTAKDVFKRIESILPKVMPEVQTGTKKEVLEFLKNAGVQKEVNIRTFINAVKCRISGSKNWQHLATTYA